MLENDMYITGIGQLQFSSYEALKSGQGITKRESPYLRNLRKPSEI